jgi:shikimate kinase
MDKSDKIHFQPQPLYLCGMMGSGKTTVGHVLASRLGFPFQDLDNLIEEKTGKSIPEIFEDEGEQGFRKIERKTILEVTANPEGIIALGGGSLQNQHLTDHIKLSGWLVYLHAPADEIARRLHHEKDRPMIKNDADNITELRNKITSLIDQRKPYYSQAHMTIQTMGQTPDQIVTKIIDKLSFYEQRHKG